MPDNKKMHRSTHSGVLPVVNQLFVPGDFRRYPARIESSALSKSNAIANTILMFVPIALVVFVVVAMTPLLSLSIIGIAYIIGLRLLIQSKWNLFHQRIWFTFGPGNFDVENRRRYFMGYAMIGSSMILNVASITFVQL